MDIVETLTDEENQRRVEIYRRSDGTFGFEAFKWVYDEKAWIPYGRFSYGIFASQEVAKMEARDRVEWLS